MPLIAVTEDDPLPEALLAEARALPPGAPIIVMLHGYRFSPQDPANDPHDHILSLDPGITQRGVTSWPRALGFGSGTRAEGLAVGFGWEAMGSLSDAYAHAPEAAAALARMIPLLVQAAGRRVEIICHSMGARVALQALPLLPAGCVGRLVMLYGAEFTAPALEAMASPAGRAAEVINVTARANDLFDFGLEMLLGARGAASIGMGLGGETRNWLDLQIDDDDSLAALGTLGFDIAPGEERICHWSAYMREGLFDLYAALLRDPARLPLPWLARQLPQRQAPRWSRLFARPPLRLPLSARRNLSS
jgi:hypothetical protein